MNFAVQYFRAPFPDREFWEEDMAAIRAAGLDAIQVWVCWAWVEAEPGIFNFDDYDAVIECARRHKLKVVLSTIAEVEPEWIHRVVPDSELVDNRGNRIVSATRSEHHFGLTPGGCFDHPEVKKRMLDFIRATVSRYARLPHLVGWDLWNEVRWAEQTNALVCYCPHTLAAWRRWLKEKYGSLEALNRAWKRRYADWLDVRPGKDPGTPCTELHQFAEFLMMRGNAIARERAEVARRCDKIHPLTVHGAGPSSFYAGYEIMAPLDRGTDFDYAEVLDGIGCSSFPKFMRIGFTELSNRFAQASSALQNDPGKAFWLSELQGGAASVGFWSTGLDFGAVRAVEQQRWVWLGLAHGASTIIFWCWRNEVFGRESSGFGFGGNDGCAEERAEAMCRTAAVVRKHESLFDRYRPDAPQVGIWFSPQSFMEKWQQEKSAKLHTLNLYRWMEAFSRNGIPTRLVEERHPEALKGVKLLILPRVIAMPEETGAELQRFAEAGGTLYMESETGAFTPEGFYRTPDRRLSARLGFTEVGRRLLPEDPDFTVTLGGEPHLLTAHQWLTPFTTSGSAKEQLYAERTVGRGRAVCCGTYPAPDNGRDERDSLTPLAAHLARLAGVKKPFCRTAPPSAAQKECVCLQWGRSEGKRVLCAVFPEEENALDLVLNDGEFASGRVRDLVSGQMFSVKNTTEGRLLHLEGSALPAVFCMEEK